MNTIILIITIICFITCLFWLVANITGGLFMKIIGRLIGIAGTLLPLIYWLKLTNII